MDLLKEIADSLIKGEFEKIESLVAEAIKAEISPKDVLDQGLLAGMQVVGENFKTHVFFLPDVLLAAKAMNMGLSILKPLLAKNDLPNVGQVILGTVKGDLHDIGKNLVGIMLEGAGFEVIDLGSDVTPQNFVDTAKEKGARVIGMSALLTTTMSQMKDVVAIIKEQGLSDKIKTIIGGAPLSKEYAQSIGADAYAYDGLNAVEKIKELYANVS